eukprot:5335612-Prymnesium_polylepis.1
MICFGLSFGENVLNMPAIVNGGAFAGVAKSSAISVLCCEFYFSCEFKLYRGGNNIYHPGGSARVNFPRTPSRPHLPDRSAGRSAPGRDAGQLPTWL